MQNKGPTFFERVKYIINKYYDGNKSKFARENDITRQYVGKWERQSRGDTEGKPNPSMEILINIISNTGVDTTWLVTGEGKPTDDHFDSLADSGGQDVSLLGRLSNSNVTADEKIKLVSEQLHMILDLIEDEK